MFQYSGSDPKKWQGFGINPNQTIDPWENQSGIGMQVPSWNPGPPQMQTGLQSSPPQQQSMKFNPLETGLKAAGSIFNYFADAGNRRIRKQGMKRLNSLYDTPSINVGGLTAYRRKATLGDTQRLGSQADQRFGLDTGRGFGWFSNNLLEGIDKGAADAFYQNELETERKRLMIAREQANYGR